jgi:YD repeat-containing protein
MMRGTSSHGRRGLIQRLSWNALGQLVSVTTGGQTVTYGYDGFGRRVLRTAGGTSTGFLYDGDHLMLEFDAANGALIREYSY